MRVLALHGFTGEGADFSALSRLADGDWFCPDLPGHGCRADAPEEEFSLDRLADRLLRNEPERSLTGLGYSMGGRLLLHLALLRPRVFNALVLIGASPGLAEPAERRSRRASDGRWQALLEREGCAAFFDQWWRQPVLRSLETLPAEQRKALRERRLRNSARGLVRSLRLHGTGSLPSLWHRLPEIGIPVLCCAGERDRKFRDLAAEMAALFPAGAVRMIPSAGHAPHLENPRETAEAVVSWERARWQAGGLGIGVTSAKDGSVPMAPGDEDPTRP